MEKEGSSKRSEENLVKKTCRELGITQKELAEKIGVSKQSVYDWSNSRTPLPKWGETILLLLIERKDFIDLQETLETVLKKKKLII